jgi:hypothetical protein
LAREKKERKCVHSLRVRPQQWWWWRQLACIWQERKKGRKKVSAFLLIE